MRRGTHPEKLIQRAGVFFDEEHPLFDESKLASAPNHFNNSIVQYGDGYLMSYRVQRDHTWRHHHNYIAHLDADLTPVANYTVDAGDLSELFSDIRLFWHQGELMASYSVLVGNLWQQGLGTITPTGVVYNHRFVSFEKQSHEKNFQFFAHGGKLHAISHILPEHVVTCLSTQERFVTNTKQFWPLETPRGGTPPIDFGDDWLTCFHTCRIDSANSMRYYTAGWYTFQKEPPFAVTGMSRAPVIYPGNPARRVMDKVAAWQKNRAVVFPTGLTRHRGKLLVSYGHNDVAPAYREFTDDEVRASMRGAPLVTWKQPNFGDALSKSITNMVAGRDVVSGEVCLSKNEGHGRLLGLGTIMHAAKEGDTVWGSGLGNHLKTGKPYRPAANLFIKAVRGPKTRQLFLEAGGTDCPEVYGDPAILLPDYYTPKRMERIRVGVLPHLHDAELAQKFPDAVEISPKTRDGLSVVDAINACDLLITSSLHGLIVAEAYGVPVVLYRGTDLRMREPDFKYDDYYASTGRPLLQLSAGKLDHVINFQKETPLPSWPDKQALKDALWTYL